MLSPLQQTAIDHPDAVAMINGAQYITYAELAIRVKRAASHLIFNGVKRGDRIGVICPHHSQFATQVKGQYQDALEHIISLYWACSEIGAIFFPINGRFAQTQIQELLTRFAIKFAYQANENLIPQENDVAWLTLNSIHSQFDAKALLEAQTIDPQCPLNVILTSGSSGKPKAAVHSMENHLASAKGALAVISLTINDRWLLSLPLFHIGGLAIVNRCALSAATLVLPDNQISLNAQLVQDKPTHVSLVPAQAYDLLNDSKSKTLFSAIKALLLGGAVIPKPLVESLLAKKVRTYISYGMTEMSSQITTTKVQDASNLHLGQVLPNRELTLRDNVIWVRGECLFKGYLSIGDNQQTQINLPIDNQGWFCTEDRGQLNEDGMLKLLGRADNMFICGGENVQPEEIEAVLLSHEHVEKAIVFGIEDAKFGNLPAAIIELNSTLNDEEYIRLTDELANRVSLALAPFKRPRRFFHWPSEANNVGLKVNRKQVVESVKQR